MARFSDLPSELRNQFYKELFQNETKLRRHTANELALFSVSKQIHKESASYFYQNNDIVIDASADATDTATLLPPISDQYLRYLRQLTVHAVTGQATLPQTCEVARTIAVLPRVGARFEELTFMFASPLSSLLNSHVDDSIMDEWHPITLAMSMLLDSQVAKILRVHLHNSWFAPGVARGFMDRFGAQLEFFVNGSRTMDTSLIERPLTGRLSSTHLFTLGLDDDLGNVATLSPVSTPAFLPSSLCSALAELETFSVTSFVLSSDEEVLQWKSSNDSQAIDANTTEQPFFGEDDTQLWTTQTEDHDRQESQAGEMDDLAEDEEMEEVNQEEISALIQNMEDAAHHIANRDDVTYMTNFAPDLLLSRHHLTHLV
ncbi:hypothetical protein EK21DRAFT_81239 [Setomelanomma holmii]|uniref:Uncharacterized protein n=1 Tax=Setomelanomma holmii TaxID=210430 RepID=A0A9P4GWK8_9PLEO|nr:hypothetical protein EK21DRAFT_81239 [Setomelanomma holmii]